MERYYKRADDIDQKIHSVKLPYLTWKVLFLIGENQSASDLKELLNEEEKAIEKALQMLLEQGLILEISEKVEEQPSEVVETGKIEETIPEEDVQKTGKEVEEETTEQAVEEEEVATEEEANEPEVEEPDLFADEEEPDFIIGKEEKQPETDLEETPSEEEQEESVFDLGSDLEDSSVFEGVETDEEEAEIAEPEIEIPEEEETKEEENLDIDIDFGAEPEQKEETVAAPEPEPIVSEKPKTEDVIVLVIDDSIVIRKMVELALENEDYQIETAVTGKDGLKLLDQLEPNIVILDLMLPDINGIDLLKTIKASKGIPVIMLSGKDSPQMIEKARAEGADAFLPKPFRDEELVQTIKKLI